MSQPDTTEQQIEKSKRAVWYLIERIRWDDGLRYRCGYGTEVFERVTEAAASLYEQPVDKVRNYALGLDLKPEVGGQKSEISQQRGET